MRVLVLGGSGNVGKLVLQQLLGRGHEVHAIVRTPEAMPATLTSEPKLSLIKANLLDLSVDDLATRLKGCDAIVCTLGHNLNYGRIPAIGKSIPCIFFGYFFPLRFTFQLSIPPFLTGLFPP